MSAAKWRGFSRATRATISPIPYRASSSGSGFGKKVREMIEAGLTETEGRVSGPLGADGKLGIPRARLESKVRSLLIDKHEFKRARA